MDRFRSLYVEKRRSRAPWSSNPFGESGDELSDVEKEPLVDEDDDESSVPSSRATSSSYDAMLRFGKSPKAAMRTASAYASKIPVRKFNRLFTLVLASILILLVVLLTGLSRLSSAKVASGVQKQNPPPAYEDFPFLQRYYGGLRTLVPRSRNHAEYPGDEQELLKAMQNATGADKEQNEKVARKTKLKEHYIPPSQPFDPYSRLLSEYPPMEECYIDAETKSKVPMVHVYDGVPKGMPENVMGSYELLGLNQDVCFDRFGRLGPYGFGYSRKLGGLGAGMDGDLSGAQHVWAQDPEVNFRTVRWAEIQERCADANKHRFKQSLAQESASKRSPTPATSTGQVTTDASPNMALPSTSNTLPRTVVLLRTWNDYKYDAEDLMYLRALIAELSIGSGTEYTVHFLIHVKDNNLQIWSDDATYQRVLKDSLPAEFEGMGTLWSERQMELLYGGLIETNYRNLPVHGVYRSTYMPMQHFAHEHPEYDFIWHWEMDARYTGHFYHLFDRIGKWAKAQPRKGLWERNARFYVPSEHGSWEDFTQMVRIQTQHGTSSKSNIFGNIGNPAHDLKNPKKAVEKPIWGPEPPEFDELDTSNDPIPPTSYDKDKYEWGVGEDADFITLNPLFDPDETGWILAEDVTGYNTTNGYPPRRTAIITASRLSRKMLETMHRETALKHHTMFSEMWPGSCALHHGLKAVYAPHPVYIDRRWPTDYLAAVFNGGRNGASGGSRFSPFNDARQVNFLGTTWYYHAGHPINLWRRWLGYKVNNDGGEEYEMAHEGRMCLPAMLLHPIKQVDLIYPHKAGE